MQNYKLTYEGFGSPVALQCNTRGAPATANCVTGLVCSSILGGSPPGSIKGIHYVLPIYYLNSRFADLLKINYILKYSQRSVS